MEINDIGTQLLYTTVPIYAQNDDKTLSTGTGFYFLFAKVKQNLFRC